MDTTERFAHPHYPMTRKPSRVRRWAARLAAIGALGAAIAATYVLVQEATEPAPPPPIPADLAR